MCLTTLGGNSFAQFLTVLIVFVFVLVLTLVTTRWIANYQKTQNVNKNIAVIETCHIATNKFIQIVQIGEIYVAIAVCKDTVTMLTEVPKEQIKFKDENGSTSFNFKDLLEKAKLKSNGKDNGPKEE